MDNTTYDEIWEVFRTICGYNPSDLPKSDEVIYSYIRQGVSKYNSIINKYEGKFTNNVRCDNDMEEVDHALKYIEIQVIAYLIASIFSVSKLSEFTSVWGVFAKETGIKEYQGQVSARRQLVKYFEDQAISLIEDDITTFDL